MIFGHAEKSQNVEHEPIPHAGIDKMIPRHTTSHSWSSSLTNVNDRMGSDLYWSLRGPGLVHGHVQDQ